MADRLARPMLHRSRTSESSFQSEQMRESRARRRYTHEAVQDRTDMT